METTQRNTKDSMAGRYKQITPENWLEPDDILRHVVHVDENGNTHPLTSEDYLSWILNASINNKAPEKVRELFEVARGAMVYGYFYIPLFTLASEQLFRVLERAVVGRSRELGASNKKSKDFFNAIKWLYENGYISEKIRDRLQNARKLRNDFSHPEGQTILFPSYAIGNLYVVCELVDELYKDS